jgi:5-methylcytosine-specific restriction endonuclease McrA
MTTFLVSDRFYGHPAVFKAGAEAVGLWVRAGSWCARHHPDGFVPASFVATQQRGKRLARRLVDAGLWEAADGGWWFAIDSAYDLWWIDRQQYRRKIPRHVRELVLERDGHACRHCGGSEQLTMDHVVPWSLGGSDDPSNLQTLCMSCNRAKGATVDG